MKIARRTRMTNSKNIERKNDRNKKYERKTEETTKLELETKNNADK